MSIWGSVVIYQLTPGKKVRATAVWQERVLPFLRKQRDFKGTYWLVAREGDRAFSIDLWDNDIAASAFESTGLYKKLMANFDLLLAHPPVRTECQVEDCLMTALPETAPASGQSTDPVAPPKPEGLVLKLLETMRGWKPKG
jgi:hypothetical protein